MKYWVRIIKKGGTPWAKCTLRWVVASLLLSTIACVDGKPGPSGPRGVRGLEGPRGDHGAEGTDGGIGPVGIQGDKGTDGNDGLTCEIATTDNGIQILCENGSNAIVFNGQAGANGTNGINGTNCTIEATDGGYRLDCENGTSTLLRNGTNGIDGADGENGQNGASCTAIDIDGGSHVECTNGSFANLFNGQNGTNGGSCSSTNVDGGLKILCEDSTQATINDGQNGLSGTNGNAGDNGQHGSNGHTCSAEETDGGITITCSDGTSALVRDGQNGEDGQNGDNGAPGQNGTGCQVSSTSNGVTISCATGSHTVHHGTNCTITATDDGLQVDCPDHSGANTSASIDNYSYVEPYGLSTITDSKNLNKNNALFVLFDAPANGIFDVFSIFQGDQGNGAENFELEIAVFEQVGANWQKVAGSNAVVIPVDETHGFDHQVYTRTGLNAQLAQGTSYMFVIRNQGPTHSWVYDYHAVSGTISNSFPHVAWTQSVSTSLDSFTTTLGSLSGTRHIPWFRLLQ